MGRAEGKSDRWMISYMDVLTILLIFFIAVAARLPAHPTAAAPATVAPKPVPSPLTEVQESLQQHGIDAKMEPRGLVISLPQQILFTSGDDRVSASALPVVDQIAEVILRVPNRVSLIGHADSRPIHNRRFASNWELSAARGLRLLELLTGHYAIPESRLCVSSEGTNRPRGSNETEEGRASNRRVEIVLLAE